MVGVGDFISEADVQLIKEKIVTVEEGYHIYVIGIEDLILDRVRAAVYWKSSADREWAFLLIISQMEEIDFNYLEKEAKKEPDPTIIELIGKLKKSAENIIIDE
ncbi:MAG: hypothetical protein M1119_07060 [Firmicutes bacterium]|nr:hypothetical protein [Bacillota bacterium]